MKYYTEITGIGPEAMEFLSMEEMNCIVIFNDDAPEDLAEICVLHTKSEVLVDPEPGDLLEIGGKVFTISAVGEEAKMTLRELGHCTLSFKGGNQAERPGCIMLEGKDKILPDEVIVGSKIIIY